MERTFELVIAADHPAFDGHFPGNPVLPGVSLLAEVIEAIAAEPAFDAVVGPHPVLAVAKFVSGVRPGDAVSLHLGTRGNGVDFRWTGADGAPAASGRFEAGA